MTSTSSATHIWAELALEQLKSGFLASLQDAKPPSRPTFLQTTAQIAARSLFSKPCCMLFELMPRTEIETDICFVPSGA